MGMAILGHTMHTLHTWEQFGEENKVAIKFLLRSAFEALSFAQLRSVKNKFDPHKIYFNGLVNSYENR